MKKENAVYENMLSDHTDGQTKYFKSIKKCEE